VQAIDQLVGERRALGVGADHPVGAGDGALDPDGGVPIDEALDVVGDVGREGARQRSTFSASTGTFATRVS
jgi:hypothetical protein